jgi:hypothetical protein
MERRKRRYRKIIHDITDRNKKSWRKRRITNINEETTQCFGSRKVKLYSKIKEERKSEEISCFKVPNVLFGGPERLLL